MTGDLERLPLEPDRPQMEAAANVVVREVIDFITGLPDAPASPLDEPRDLAALLAAPPEAAQPFEVMLARALDALRQGFEPAGPGYLAYIPGGGLFLSGLADLLADATNRYAGIADAAPGLVAIDQSLLRWLASMVGYDADSAGDLTSGGSISILSAVVTARHAVLADDFLDGTVYVSDQIHHSVVKAARIAGIKPANVRVIPTGRGLRLDPDRVTEAIALDRGAGLRPFLVVGSAGTTNAGSVDALDDLSALATANDMWFHVDGAYGGMFQLTDRGRAMFAGIEQSDSVTVDPHKGLFVPYGTGALLVREGTRLRDAFTVHGDYMRDLDPEQSLPNASDHGPELTRHARGLRVWLPLHVHGVAAFRDALDEKLDLARWAYEELLGVDELELPWPPDLSVVCFRHRGGDTDTLAMLRRVNKARRVHLSSTTIDGDLYVRICVLSFRTHHDRVAEAVELIRAACR